MEKARIIFEFEKSSIKNICEFMDIEFTEELWSEMSNNPVVLKNKNFIEEPMTNIAIGSIAIRKAVEIKNLKFKN